MKCRNCGCTEAVGCVLDENNELVDIEDGTIAYNLAAAGLHVCYWVADELCSGCVVNPPPPLLFGPDGQPLRGAP